MYIFFVDYRMCNTSKIPPDFEDFKSGLDSNHGPVVLDNASRTKTVNGECSGGRGGACT